MYLVSNSYQLATHFCTGTCSIIMNCIDLLCSSQHMLVFNYIINMHNQRGLARDIYKIATLYQTKIASVTVFVIDPKGTLLKNRSRLLYLTVTTQELHTPVAIRVCFFRVSNKIFFYRKLKPQMKSRPSS